MSARLPLFVLSLSKDKREQRSGYIVEFSGSISMPFSTQEIME